MSTHASSVRAQLSRLISACSGELLAIDDAIRRFGSDPRGEQLRYYSRRRAHARTELCAAVTELRGAPRRSAPLGARLASTLRAIPNFFAGANDGDILSVVANATDKTELAYWGTKQDTLPDRFRPLVDRQYQEVQQDSRDLWRLRWGGSVTLPSIEDAGQEGANRVAAQSLPAAAEPEGTRYTPSLRGTW